MINLLPTHDLESIMYARRNTTLLKWLMVSVLAIVGIVAIVGAGHVIINRSANQVASQLAVGQEQLRLQKLEETQSRVEDISASLKLATQVLSRQVVLSELLPQIGAVLPNGTALAGLQLNKLEGGLDLAVAANDFQTATQVQVNLQDPNNKLFAKADINTITCNGSEDPRYPCAATYRVLFAENHPYSLLGQESTP